MAEKAYLNLVAENFQSIKQQADRAIDQLNLEEIHYSPNDVSNSIAILVRHMSGNLRSRFSSFLTTDGEKPDRNRDGEFQGKYETKDAMLESWNSGWNVLFDTLHKLKEEDLNKTVYTRNEPHSVMEAIQRQVVHQAGHSGQIVFLAKMIKDQEWKTLSIPKVTSKPFNDNMTEQFKQG